MAPQQIPNGMKPVTQAGHALGLRFGIYEDAGFETCGGRAGSGKPDGGSKTHFAQEARLFASWGVAYLKLDGYKKLRIPGYGGPSLGNA
jgi:alpha-galactosidase